MVFAEVVKKTNEVNDPKFDGHSFGHGHHGGHHGGHHHGGHHGASDNGNWLYHDTWCTFYEINFLNE